MDIATLIGLIVGVVLVAYGMADPSTMMPSSMFFNPQAFAIVLGGTLAATLVNYPIKRIFGLFKVTAKVFLHRQNDDPLLLIQEMSGYAQIARKQGVAALEGSISRIQNGYLQRGLENAILTRDPAKLLDFLDNELDSMIERHQSGQEIFYNMGSYAPAFGLLGTVMGLILMMGGQSDNGTGMASFASDSEGSMNMLLTGMGRALVTTFYGVLFSNLFFIPIAGKLKTRTEDEVALNRIIRAGVLSIHERDHHLVLEEKLLTFVDKQTREMHRINGL
jgi:chemotaxis protein MotA